MKNLIKLIWIAAVALVIGIGYGADVMIAGTYDMKVIETSAQPAVADGQTPIVLKVEVTKNGRPQNGHIILIASGNGGSFKSKRVTTDKNGIAEFIYFPYLKSKLNTLTDVYLSFTDESNSLFVSVPVTTYTIIRMREPDAKNEQGKTNEGMFG